MTEVIIIVPQGYSASKLLDRVRGTWRVRQRGHDNYVIEAECGHVLVEQDHIAASIYHAEEPGLMEKMPQAGIYGCSSEDFRLLKQVLTRLADDDGILVDDDHGRITSGREFAQLLASQPEVDWRR